MKARCGTRRLAFTLIEIIVVATVLALLVLVVLPGLTQAKKRSSKLNCVNNLKQVGLAFHIWAGDNGDKFPMSVLVTNGGTKELVASGQVFPHFQVMSNELNTPKILACPYDRERSPATNFTSDFDDSRISYFVGVDADQTQPKMLLSGDRNVMVAGKTFRGIVDLGTNDQPSWTSLIHSRQGNLLFADGSVQQVAASGLRRYLVQSGVTNRLVFP